MWVVRKRNIVSSKCASKEEEKTKPVKNGEHFQGVKKMVGPLALKKEGGANKKID